MCASKRIQSQQYTIAHGQTYKRAAQYSPRQNAQHSATAMFHVCQQSPRKSAGASMLTMFAEMCLFNMHVYIFEFVPPIWEVVSRCGIDLPRITIPEVQCYRDQSERSRNKINSENIH